jgi:hypothetical protein
MVSELYSDGVSEVTITGSIVRIDFMSLSASERDANNNPVPVVRQRIIMPVEAFANSFELLKKVMNGLVEAGAVTQATAPRSDAPRGNGSEGVAIGRDGRNTSPNFRS